MAFGVGMIGQLLKYGRWFACCLVNALKPTNVRFEEHVRVQLRNKGTLALGNGCYITRHTDFIVTGGVIEIAGDFFCNKGCTFSAKGKITFGHGVRIGEYVSIYDHNHKHDRKTSSFHDDYTQADVTIGNNVWIARGAVILKGAVLGDGCVIGANAVVRGVVAPGETVML